MDGTIKRLGELSKQVHELSILIDEHLNKDPRYKEILTEFVSAGSKRAMYEAVKKYNSIFGNFGIGEKAEKMQAELQKQYGDLLDVKYYKPKYLFLIIEAIENGQAETVEQAVDIAVEKVNGESDNYLIERIAADKNLI